MALPVLAGVMPPCGSAPSVQVLLDARMAQALDVDSSTASDALHSSMVPCRTFLTG